MRQLSTCATASIGVYKHSTLVFLGCWPPFAPTKVQPRPRTSHYSHLTIHYTTDMENNEYTLSAADEALILRNQAFVLARSVEVAVRHRADDGEVMCFNRDLISRLWARYNRRCDAYSALVY